MHKVLGIWSITESISLQCQDLLCIRGRRPRAAWALFGITNRRHFKLICCDMYEYSFAFDILPTTISSAAKLFARLEDHICLQLLPTTSIAIRLRVKIPPEDFLQYGF